jgi:hypothetical protein
VDVLLDDPVFLGPFESFFGARIGRSSIPMEIYLRLMFLKLGSRTVRCLPTAVRRYSCPMAGDRCTSK